MENNLDKTRAQQLEVLLATIYSLLLKTQNYHWNVKGSSFYSLHLLFEKHYNELAVEVDSVAEVISALGHLVPASFAEYSAISLIKDSNKNVIKFTDMLSNLVKDHRLLISHIEELLPKFNGLDSVTNLLSGIVEKHTTMAWMLNSSL
ncbi:MAG: DNA starvation/stationary phase protection protein [Alphaproteobacteria bacterium]|nr:DNA starvation/stationary phase protection protein [Rickettsiales bacterium]